MSISPLCNRIFIQSIDAYHLHDNLDHPCPNPYSTDTLEHLLFHKNWVDTVQWHLEDVIRDPAIDPVAALAIKRRIDRSNQVRTDTVEQIDDYFFQQYAHVETAPDARLNTETPAWAIDRLSILQLKIYHMREETLRTDATATHIAQCQHKLNVLLQQCDDLSGAIDQLLADIEAGRCIVKTYKQMKMYNDPQLNPILRQQSATDA